MRKNKKCILISVNGDNVICDFYKIILGDIMGYEGKSV